MPPRERQIILLRYFSDKTQSEIASLIGVSQVQISRILQKTLQKLRQSFLTAEYLFVKTLLHLFLPALYAKAQQQLHFGIFPFHDPKKYR